ncbi:MAG TPA: D-amino acid aminotransferase, partial [Bacillota bacterium]
TVYLNGQYVPYSQALVPVEDRAFLFADGIYEVVRCYGGKPFHLDRHFERLRDSAAGLDLPVPLDEAGFARIVAALLERNRLREATVYLQVTRGAAPRQHQFPREATPTVVAIARPAQSPPEDQVRAGVSVITVPDTRWGLCYLKTVGLLPNVLARQQAQREGAFDAVFVRDGLVTEASSSNVFCAFDGVVHTHPLANILPGVTRAVVLEILADLGIPYREEAVPLQRFRGADEIFLTGTTLEVMGVVQVDGRRVGAGRTGPLTLRVWDAFRQRCASL